MKKAGTALLSAVLGTSILLTACGTKEENVEKSDTKTTKTTTTSEKKAETNQNEVSIKDVFSKDRVLFGLNANEFAKDDSEVKPSEDSDVNFISFIKGGKIVTYQTQHQYNTDKESELLKFKDVENLNDSELLKLAKKKDKEVKESAIKGHIKYLKDKQEEKKDNIGLLDAATGNDGKETPQELITLENLKYTEPKPIDLVLGVYTPMDDATYMFLGMNVIQKDVSKDLSNPEIKISNDNGYIKILDENQEIAKIGDNSYISLLIDNYPTGRNYLVDPDSSIQKVYLITKNEEKAGKIKFDAPKKDETLEEPITADNVMDYAVEGS